MIDKLLGFTLDLNRLDAKTKQEVIKLLNKAQRELAANLAMKDLTRYSKLRTNALLKEARATIESYYEQAQMKLFDTLEPLPELVAKQTARALETKLPADMSASLPPIDMLKTMADDTMVLGAVTKEWWTKQAADVTFRYSSAVRQGLAVGETNQQIAKRVVQVMDIARRNAVGLVQTSVASVANNARQATFEANSDVVKGYKWISALDANVCELCIARADKEWTFKSQPIDHGIPFSTPPIHFNDRCILTAVTKTFAELGIKGVKEAKPGERASTDGPVSAKTTFDDFLKRKGEAWQDEVLGKGRADLWRSGKINLENLIGGSGRPLTVNQLRSKYK